MRGLTDPILPDILRADLRIVFCGSAAGGASARAEAYYAGPGNKFWRILHETGLTPHRLEPREYRTLPDYGIGLTDMAKHAYGSDANLPASADDPAGLHGRIVDIHPSFLAFNGKRAAQVFFRHLFDIRKIDYGSQSRTIGSTRVFILPSTSGAANGFWDPTPWHALAKAARDAENALK